jgi:RNA polymerase sigma-70 factor (ECF subfamily)
VETGTLKREVRRAARGDQEAAAALFDHYHPRVFRYALAKVGNRAVAEDVAAESFAKVLAELGRFRWKGAGFEAWLFRIASNLVVDHVRASHRETTAETVQAEDAGSLTPEQAVLHGELSKELKEMLAELAPDQREVLLLRFAAGLGAGEVGEVMGRKPNAVRQLQFRALENLRRRMLQGAETT